MEKRFFRIRRFNPPVDHAPYYQTFLVDPLERMSVLEGLFQIQDRLDASLAFRYACRWAVCGSCAMVINGKIKLACRTQLRDLKSRRVSIEPLPGLPVIRDLVVDMEPFWKAYRAVKPWLAGRQPPPEREYLMSEKERKKIDRYVNCILCAACYGACPVVLMDRDKKAYLGPAALAKAYRFEADPRHSVQHDERPLGRSAGRHIGEDASAAVLDSMAGVWGCHQILRCTRFCPKDVRPSDGIMGLRRMLFNKRFLLRKSVR